jgi:hypothetical protein
MAIQQTSTDLNRGQARILTTDSPGVEASSKPQPGLKVGGMKPPFWASSLTRRRHDIESGCRIFQFVRKPVYALPRAGIPILRRLNMDVAMLPKSLPTTTVNATQKTSWGKSAICTYLGQKLMSAKSGGRAS